MKKNILIAGGTDGIGFAFVKKCLESNSYAKIFILGRKLDKINKLNDQRLIPIICDITATKTLKTTLDKINVPLDEFINTIGTFIKKPVKKTSMEEIRNHFELNSIANITLTTLILPKLKKKFSQILVCLATLSLVGRENYSLQSATKASYRMFLESLRQEIGNNCRVMMVHPSSVQTDIFAKAGDKRDLTKYPSADTIASIMDFMLTQPENIELPEIAIYNRT